MFFFKGDRKYLNSADVYSFLKKNFQFKSLDIKFYKFIKSQPSIKVVNKLSVTGKTAPSIAASIVQKNRTKIVTFYPTKEKILHSYSYDDNLLNNYFKIKKNSVVCNLNTSIKYIDLVVSMSKYWHQKVINSKKKWIVIRLSLGQKIKPSLKKKLG